MSPLASHHRHSLKTLKNICSYWDYPYDDFKYSFVKTATAAGYSTFAIDRYAAIDVFH